jgi:hypothetical protein
MSRSLHSSLEALVQRRVARMKTERKSWGTQNLTQLATLKYLQASMAPVGPERDDLLKTADSYRARAFARRWVEDQILLLPISKEAYH